MSREVSHIQVHNILRVLVPWSGLKISKLFLLLDVVFVLLLSAPADLLGLGYLGLLYTPNKEQKTASKQLTLSTERYNQTSHKTGFTKPCS